MTMKKAWQKDLKKLNELIHIYYTANNNFVGKSRDKNKKIVDALYDDLNTARMRLINFCKKIKPEWTYKELELRAYLEGKIDVWDLCVEDTKKKIERLEE